MGEAKAKLEEKKKQFEANPEDFVNMNDVLFAIRIDQIDGEPDRHFVVNNCKSIDQVYKAQGICQEFLGVRIAEIRMFMARNKSIIAPPVGGMPNGKSIIR